MSSVSTQFVLLGFSQDREFRVFGFKETAADRTQTMYAVRADMAMALRYGIRLQELPLLCREVLERRLEGEQKRAFTYSEADMRVYADNRAAARSAAAQRKGPARKTLASQA